MKKFLLIALLLLASANLVSAEADCPFGIVDDQAPGECGLYIDQNADYVCDRSATSASETTKQALSEAELKMLNIDEVARYFNIDAEAYRKEISDFLKKDVSLDKTLQVLHDDNGLCAGVAANIAQNLVNNVNIAKYSSASLVAVASQASSAVAGEASDSPVVHKYKFGFILIGLLTLYLLSSLAVKAKYYSQFVHRRIWNSLLLITFLVSAIFGIILILSINFGWFISIYPFIIYWHVEFGSAMAIISLIHIVWHWSYYLAIFKKKT